MIKTPENHVFFDRDLSWLSFNYRVLQEAARSHTPLLERIKFLSIYSSNLDEFYRVRMPILQALKKINKNIEKQDGERHLLAQAIETIHAQLQEFGAILQRQVLLPLKAQHTHFLYNEDIPAEIQPELSNYFLSYILAYLQPIAISGVNDDFFPANNQLYFLVSVQNQKQLETYIINIPSEELSRFYTIVHQDVTYILMIDDIIRLNLPLLFRDMEVKACHSFKVTRNADIDLKDEYHDDIAEQIEKQLHKRDMGLATRLLYEPGVPEGNLALLIERLDAQYASIVEGGRYHNLKDLANFPVHNSSLSNNKWPQIPYPPFTAQQTLAAQIVNSDILINPPYHSYDSVLRFFNEAATDKQVTEIYTTLYRVAKDSKIGTALITAAKNGKKVTVLVELKARFDEANNIKWAKKMRAAGVEILYSVTALKVHAKIALVKRNLQLRTSYIGLLATGNFNETTANFYTDHILMTAHQGMLRELELLFIFLAKRQKPTLPLPINFEYLLVAQFNLQERFIALIDHEITQARLGLTAAITIKINNLEEETMITKLYEAAEAGVQITLLVRGICRLIPRKNLIVKRIVDRYLEHGRIFLFHHSGEELMYLGSADWMERNIYRRIEVCFPIVNANIKTQLKQILSFQLADNVQAVHLDRQMNNIPITDQQAPLQSQHAIYTYLLNTKNE